MDQNFHAQLNVGIGKLMPLMGQVMSHIRCHVSCACERAGYKLTPEEAGTLMILYECDGLSQSKLAKILGKDKASITRLMNALVKSGLVGRVQDRGDRRVIRANITEEGKQAFADIFPALVALSELALADVSKQDFEAAQRLLGQIIQNVCTSTDSTELRCGESS